VVYGLKILSVQHIVLLILIDDFVITEINKSIYPTIKHGYVTRQVSMSVTDTPVEQCQASQIEGCEGVTSGHLTATD
jgi:hypothetical protein